MAEIGGGEFSTTSVLDGGDGDDFIGASADSNWLVGGSGNDLLQAVGASNALIGGERARNDGRPQAPGPGTAAVSRRRSVRSQNPVGKTVPVACRDREKALPDARWRARIWGTQGGAQRQLQAWPLHRRDDGLSSVAEGDDPRSEGVDQDASRPALIACKPNPDVPPHPLHRPLPAPSLSLAPARRHLWEAFQHSPPTCELAENNSIPRRAHDGCRSWRNAQTNAPTLLTRRRQARQRCIGGG